MADDASGFSLLEWRKSKGWDVPRLAQELRRAADEIGEQVAVPGGLVKMIAKWEAGTRRPRERYRLLYARLGFTGIIPPQPPSPEDGRVADRIAENAKHLAASRNVVSSTRDYVKAAREHAARIRDATDHGGGGRAADLVARFAALPDEDQIRRMAADPDAAATALRAAADALNALADLMAEGGDDDD